MGTTTEDEKRRDEEDEQRHLIAQLQATIRLQARVIELFEEALKRLCGEYLH